MEIRNNINNNYHRSKSSSKISKENVNDAIYTGQQSKDEFIPSSSSTNKKIEFSDNNYLQLENLNEVNHDYSKKRRRSNNYSITHHKNISNFTNSSLLSKNNSAISRMDRIFEKHPDLEKLFGGPNSTINRDPAHLKLLLNRWEKRLFISDIFCMIVNITVVTWLYFDNFDYVNNNYTITSNGNICRIVCFCLSLSVCFALYYRFYQKSKVEKLKYILNLRNTIYGKKIKLKKLTYEICIHMMLPYPKVSFFWTSIQLGYEVTYSINMILFTLSMLRLYVVFKIIKYYNLFTKENSKRIFKFYGNKNINLFFYKANIKYFAMISVMVITSGFIYLFALVFKIYEDYESNNQAGFYYIWNCLWFLVQTMTTIGYGDILPTTLIGRVIAIICCILGVFLLSLITVSLLLYIMLDSDIEIKAFNTIEMHHTKGQRNNYFMAYFNSFIAYKMNRIRSAKYVKNRVEKYFTLRNRLKIAKEQNFIMIKAGLKEQLSLPQFCENIKQDWEIFHEDMIYNIGENVEKLFNKSSYFVNNVQLFTSTAKTAKTNAFKMVNLMKFIDLCESPFEVVHVNDFRGDSVVSEKKFTQTFKEFYIKYNNKIVQPRKSQINLNKTLLFKTKRTIKGLKNSGESIDKALLDFSEVENDVLNDSNEEVDDDEVHEDHNNNTEENYYSAQSSENDDI